MSVIHTERERSLDARLLIIPVILTVAFIVFFFRLWFLNVVQASALTERADTLRATSMSVVAPRGIIVDRKGRLLAGIRPEIVVSAIPATVAKDNKGLKALSALMDLPLDKLQDKAKNGSWRPYLPTPVVRNTPIHIASEIVEESNLFPGLVVQSQPMRYYSDTTSLAHILGYVWTPDEKDIRRLERSGRKPSEFVGKLGIEYQYELDLMGREGKDKLEVDNRRRPLRSVSSDNPVPGMRLILSIDADLQRYAQDLLGSRRGAVVALDPTNGEVLCLVSSPTYDTSLFQGGISTADFKSLMNDPEKPQINRAISAAYAPGSTFKIVTTLAAVKSGKFNPNETVFCPGYLKVGNKRIKCLGHHGAISYQRALAKSCNTYFMTLALRSGPDAIREACKDVGLGFRTGIDLRSESRGVVPTREWVLKHKRPPDWYPGNTAIFGIGQGELAVTPLQMASLVSFIANEGYAYRPHLLKAKVAPGADSKPVAYEPEILGREDVSPLIWRMMKSAMRQVIEDGTAGKARISGLVWGGKTGSAENHMKQLDTHSWFIGIAPLDHPRIAIAVLVENAGHGGDVAAPIARGVVERYLFPPAKPAKASSKTPEASVTVSTPVPFPSER